MGKLAIVALTNAYPLSFTEIQYNQQQRLRERVE
jgi:hypothetical protein